MRITSFHEDFIKASNLKSEILEYFQSQCNEGKEELYDLTPTSFTCETINKNVFESTKINKHQSSPNFFNDQSIPMV